MYTFINNCSNRGQPDTNLQFDMITDMECVHRTNMAFLPYKTIISSCTGKKWLTVLWKGSQEVQQIQHKQGSSVIQPCLFRSIIY